MMRNKIALEEHFGAVDPDIVGQSEEHFTPETWPEARKQLLDVNDIRLRKMDALGIERNILSLLAPGIQSMYNSRQAVDWAGRLNDHVAKEIAKHSDRFSGFAALPMQDPDAACAELERCVTELGFVGALVNGFSQVGDASVAVYLDDRRYWPFWETVQRLGVPVYLHPRDPLEDQQKIYEGHPWLLGSAWAFSVETGTHALRLMGSGLFDAYPGVQVILGHLGELLPYNIWRTDHRIPMSPRGIAVKQKFAYYLHQNFYVTTSGNFHTPSLADAIIEMGADRILFSTDYPFESMEEAANWYDGIELGEPNLQKIGRDNAVRLFKL
ncbi:amidohydrolase family protein [Streptomyces olivoreticuli]|uniref:amidohydrolase family protein n=1 Tax=Streptomyces olivoreticuli TaxID=68246 RepID=UPI002659F752|nr:amidohydrolase family protein [Streptomyces olivoreticuli]WKK24264.1 amidohydrolase family protein [Streptomyces olivoreticuli]